MSGPGRLRHRVGQAIATHDLWRPGDRVAIAVSGGLDSVCLLDLLHRIAGWHGGSLSVITVDHGTRPGSAGDADFVEDLAASLGVPCARADLSLGPGASEATLRDGRYAVFEAIDVDRVALAHHREDLAETVLLHLIRGTGVAGLSGMRWRRGRYVRPLLEVSRAQLRDWAEHRGLAHREDPSNADPRFLRNRLRHEVLPLLEDLRPGATKGIARSARLAADEDALVASLCMDPPEDGRWALAELRAIPDPIVRRLLRAAADPLTSSHIDAALQMIVRGSGQVMLPGAGRRLQIVGDQLHLVEPEGG